MSKLLGIGILLCWLQGTSLAMDEGTVNRRKVNAFTITMSPWEAPLSSQEIATARNEVETVISDYLLRDTTWPLETTVTYFGLAQVLSSTWDDTTSKVQITMDGLVYFSDTSVVPTEEELLQVIQPILTAENLLPVLTPFFPTLTRATLALPTSLPTLAPSLPTLAPTVLQTTAPSAAPTPSDVIPGVIASPTESNDTDKIAYYAGSAAAVLLAMLLAVVWHSRKRDRIDTAVVNRKEIDHDTQEGSLQDTSTESPSPDKTMDTTSPSLDDLQYSRDETEDAAVFPHHHNTSNSRQELDHVVTPMPSLSDVESSLDYNVDDLTLDDSVSVRTGTTSQGGIVTVESFQQQRTPYVIKKDMLQPPDVLHSYHSPTTMIDASRTCALTPTDVSAATLAFPTHELEEASIPDLPPKPKQSTSTGPALGTIDGDPALGTIDGDPALGTIDGDTQWSFKFPWWASGSKQPQSPSHREEVQSSDGTSFGTPADWDPDDNSMGTPFTSDDEEERGDKAAWRYFGKPTVENKDERFLLQHSLRNESYKMQRLRTPPPSSTPSTRGGPRPLMPSALELNSTTVRHDNPIDSDSDYESSMQVL